MSERNLNDLFEKQKLINKKDNKNGKQIYGKTM